MPTYVYETLPSNGEAPERFELRQSMKDAPLTRHPERDVPVRRVIMGGTGVMGSAGGGQTSSGGNCGVSCGCHG